MPRSRMAWMRRHDPGRLVRIHPRRGLVEQQEARLRDQRAGDLQPSAVGVGEAVGEVVDAREQAVLEEAQRGEAPRARGLLLVGDPARPGDGTPQPGALVTVAADQDVLEHRHALEDAARLKGAGDAEGRDLMRRARLEGHAAEEHAALVRDLEAAQAVEERGLAGAVGADEPDDLVLAEREAHAA